MDNLQKIFSEIPKTYELLNGLFTFGLDTYWRKKAARVASGAGGKLWLDICSGTGQMARYLSKSAPRETRIIASDFCLPMLKYACAKNEAEKISFCIADARNLPFCEGTFDLITISFATRNINVSREGLLKCLQEFRRVLKPGGRFVNLETSQPSSNFIRKFFHLYIRSFIKPIGQLISGSKKAYAYLSSTIPRFFTAREFGNLMQEAGLLSVRHWPLTLGIVAIHTGVR